MDYVLEFSEADNVFVYRFFWLKIGILPFPRFTLTYVKFHNIGLNSSFFIEKKLGSEIAETVGTVTYYPTSYVFIF